jgi:transposase
MTLPQDFIGVDIARDWIDVFRLSTGARERVATTGPALARFARSAGGALVVLEASGGYERGLVAALVRAGVDHARVNPRQAREFARATGRLAKTDRVDAEELARMGRALELAPTPALDASRARLAALVARRDDLVAMIRSEKNRARQTGERWIAREIARLLGVLQRHLAAVEAEIEALLAADAALGAQTSRLRAVPGIGPAVAAVLLARLPELGRLGRRQIASLAGLAPHACDSGLHRGKRRIWGGRADLRRALYIAAFIASRRDPTLKAFRTRLEAAGKTFKLAVTACARKLLTILNAMFRDHSDYRSA